MLIREERDRLHKLCLDRLLYAQTWQEEIAAQDYERRMLEVETILVNLKTDMFADALIKVAENKMLFFDWDFSMDPESAHNSDSHANADRSQSPGGDDYNDQVVGFDWDEEDDQGLAMKAFNAVFQENTSLQELELCAHADLTQFCEILKKNTTLMKLELTSSMLLKFTDMPIIAEALEENKDLEHLIIRNNQLDAEDIKVLFSALTADKNNSLTQLDISNNVIGNRGAMVIARWLRNENTVLEELNISTNMMTPMGILIMLEALKKNKTLHMIDLSADWDFGFNINGLRDVPAPIQALAEMLKENTTLEEIKIHSWLREGDSLAPMEWVARALETTNTTLTKLSHNLNAEDTIIKRINFLLKRNCAMARAETHAQARNIFIKYNAQYQEKFNIPMSNNPPLGKVFGFNTLKYLAFRAYVKSTSEEKILADNQLPQNDKDEALLLKRKEKSFSSYRWEKIFQDTPKPEQSAHNDNSYKRKIEDLNDDNTSPASGAGGQRQCIRPGYDGH